MMKRICCCLLFFFFSFNFPLYAKCTNSNLAYEAPYFFFPAMKPFRHTVNAYLSSLFMPFHIAHDLILNEGEPIVLQGRFDYDWMLHKDLNDEYIHVYLYEDNSMYWSYVGKYITNSDGKIQVRLAGKKEGDYLVRMVVEGDQSFVDAYVSVVKPQHEAIVFDIDGTLTLSDFEAVKDYLDLKQASPYAYAREVLNHYRQKGYMLIFLTARPYWMGRPSREWLTEVLQQSPWPLKTRATGLLLPKASQYKSEYLKELIEKKKIKIVRAYGNATTDIDAYALAGIPKKETFIIGPHAGKKNTQPLGRDYFNHFYQVVLPTPPSQCTYSP